ncbi:MAG: ftsY [Candidatus Aminicenantes bacterium]|nr:ftsY [Candidatus Aminicenantes bacterium]
MSGPGFDSTTPNLCVDGMGTPYYNGFAVLGNLREKIARSRRAFREKLENLFQSGLPRDKILEGLAEALILADTGVPATDRIIQAIKDKTRRDDSLPAIQQALRDELVEILGRNSSGPALALPPPAVIMMVGVNGGGKTTSLAKLALHYREKGRKVLMVAADTFRAAAQEQLGIWGKRLDIPVIRGQYGADPAAVVFDAIQSFKARAHDVLLVDTAGRVHTNANLMNELEKIKRIIGREIPGAPHEILLVLDSTIGQNALVQAREFLKFAGITGLFLTKLDGTAKGGSAIGIVAELGLPIKYIGIGEAVEDLLPFSPGEFVNALIS